MPLPADATLETVWNKLTHPRQYVAGVRQKMVLCQRQEGNSYVRIGITGSGQKPCYRIFARGNDGHETIVGSYWDTHEPLSREDAVNSNWSDAALSLEQLDALLRERTGYRGPAPRV